MPTVSLRFADGDVVRVAAKADETVLAAAKRAGIALSSDCEVGDCQTCRATCLDGDFDYDEGASVSLSQDEIEAGEILPCVACARTDMAIRLPYERSKLIPAKPFSVKIESVVRLAGSVLKLTVRTQGLSPLKFLPGQYVNVQVPGTAQWRSYSMANAGNGDRQLQFLIRVFDEGAMSRYLAAEAAPGDVLQCRGPQGVFYLRNGLRPLLMVAGGTGIAPMMSMLRQMIADKDPRDVTLCFGVTAVRDLFAVDELRQLARALSGLELRVAVASGEPPMGVRAGLVTELIGDGRLDGHDVYLCGPPAMTDAARDIALAQGAPSDCIINERFIPAAPSEEAVPT